MQYNRAPMTKADSRWRDTMTDGASNDDDPNVALEIELREDRDYWKKRAESAEYALAPYLCPKCSTCLTPLELGHTMCRKCAEKDMAKRLLGLPDDWYDDTPDRRPQ
jgi:hypothetical protein